MGVGNDGLKLLVVVPVTQQIANVEQNGAGADQGQCPQNSIKDILIFFPNLMMTCLSHRIRRRIEGKKSKYNPWMCDLDM